MSQVIRGCVSECDDLQTGILTSKVANTVLQTREES